MKLSPLKARIFDLVRRAGAGGINRRDLFNVVFANDDARSRKHSFATLKSHIAQINALIEDSGFYITGRDAARLVRRNIIPNSEQRSSAARSRTVLSGNSPTNEDL